MTDADDTTSLQEQLSAHRATLAALLRQVATHTAAYAPPPQINGIAEARAEIARLKTQLRDRGVAVDDDAQDVATPGEVITQAGAPTRGIRQTIEGGDHNIQAVDNTVTVNQSSDQIDARGSQGFINRPSGPIIQNIGTHYHPTTPRAGSPFSVPYPTPAQLLVGRDNLLATLRTRLCGSEQIRLALAGMPGAGKTSLALTLAYDAQIRQHFAGGVLMASLGQRPDLASIPRRWSIDLNIQLDSRATIDEQLQRITAQLNRAALPYLMIIDDVWDSADARPFLFTSPYVSLLFTGRQRDALHSVDFGDLVGSKNIITIPPLDEDQAVELLRHSAELSAPAHQPELEALVALVGGLPLLLDAMGRYLRDQRQQHQERWFAAALDDLQSTARRLNLPITPITQARTNLSAGLFARFRRKPITPLNTRVVVALSVAALPRDLQTVFVRLAALPPDPLTFGADSAHATAETSDDMLRLLVRRSLLAEAGDGRFRLHRVLWDWAENRDARAVRDARRYLADWHAALTTPDFAEEFDIWRLNPDNWQHMLQTWHAAIEDPEALRGAIQTILPLLINQGYARYVLPGLLRALDIFQRVKSEYKLVTDIRYCLGQTYYYLADYPAAREVLAVALTGMQRQNWAIGQAMVFSLLNLIEQAAGNYTVAHQYSLKALDLTPASNKRNYAVALGNRASILYAQGDNAAACSLFERALAILEEVLGPTHSDTVTCMNNLASALEAQGDYSAARPLFDRALALREQTLGPDHPLTSQSLNNLAYLYQSQGEYAAARPLFERAVAIAEQALGSNHPDTAQSLKNLALLNQAQGDYTAARVLFERALAIVERQLGLNHPTALMIRTKLNALDVLPRTTAQ